MPDSLLAVTILWRSASDLISGEDLINFFPTSATSGMDLALWYSLTIVALIIYRMTGNWMIAGIIEAIGVVAVVIVSFVKSSLFENILVNIMKKLYLADIFDNVAYNKLFDVSGLILYLSVAGVFIFLTMQSIQKRRWS